ncbi:ly6/PLAUR domain-containing protein 6 isoform X1 [Bubalus bubalis]|uniref:ly6/PLAUR domain-containing protein 6 isoform X1 n=1 Tax=Bubalus bubalis TaxID=89462 RepID=UPI001E1B8984|nr:ly6/PLAUR domain-containing protein 6 isoform X1 [Bubalus bubalis]
MSAPRGGVGYPPPPNTHTRALIGLPAREAGLVGCGGGRRRVLGASGSGARAPRRPVTPRRASSLVPSLPCSLSPSSHSPAPAARWRGSALHTLGAPQCSWDGAAGCRWRPESACSRATPYPGGFKCFTCEKAADNYECNRWAPDIYCPRETRYCYTQHTMEVTGNSISVTKRCVPLEDCLSTGCRDSEHEGHKVCTSCCEGNICNLPLPRNETDATFATTSPINQTNGHPHCMSVIVSCLWVWLGLTL